MQTTAIIKQVELEAVGDPAAAREALAELMRQTRAEPGCILFEIHEHHGNSSRFSLWEHFADQAAFDQHLAEAHTQAFFEGGWTRLVQRQDLRLLSTKAYPETV